MDKAEILSTLKKHKAELQRKYPVSSLALFGSYARNEEKENSDIDILYELKSTYSLFDLMDLQETLQMKLNRKVDLVSKKYINKHLKPFIERDLKNLYSA